MVDGRFDSKNDAVYWFGVTGDVPVVIDWGNDGGKKIGVYRRGTWILDRNGNNLFDRDDLVFQLGEGGDIPVTGHWK